MRACVEAHTSGKSWTKGLCGHGEPAKESSVAGTLSSRKPPTPLGSRGEVGRGTVRRIYDHKQRHMAIARPQPGKEELGDTIP